MSRMLWVHAYAVNMVNGIELLDPFMEATINHVARVHTQYDVIALPGGWHTKELGVDRLLSDVQYDRLVALEVPKEKIYKFHIEPWRNGDPLYMPPRSTQEEILLAAYRTARQKEKYEITPCLVSYFAPMLWYYQKLGVNVAGVELVQTHDDPIKAMNCTKAVINRLLKLVEDPAMESQEIEAHLNARTLGNPRNYYRANPKDYFAF